MPKLQHLDAEGLHVMADLIVKSVFATLPDISLTSTRPNWSMSAK